MARGAQGSGEPGYAIMTARVFTLLAAPLLAAIIWLLYVQGTALVPRFHGHPFHDVPLIVSRDSDFVGTKMSDETQDIGMLTHLGYALALAKFPDVASCLSQPNAPLSVTSALNWDSIKRPKQAAVCFFNVAHAFGSRDLVIQWLSNMPKHDQSIHGVEVKLGKRPQLFLALSLTALLDKHCLENAFRCVIGGYQSIAIDMNDSGEVRVLLIMPPKLSIN